MQHKVENLLTGQLMEFKNNEDFIRFAKDMAIEYGDPIVIEYLEDAMDYLNTYCDNLLLL